MCRMLIAASKQPVLLADLLTRPAHSIINQSYDSRLRLDTRRPVNGDGFGVGWYDDAATPPCIFTSVLPAWNNLNLHRLAEKIRSCMVFGHVRASTGGSPSSETNCHPWNYRRLMWMHNGNVAGFRSIKRVLQADLKESIFQFVQGSTDSEWCFAVFLNQLDNPDADHFAPAELKAAMLATIALVNSYQRAVFPSGSPEQLSFLNFAVTDGTTVIATRYVNSPHYDAASLYFSSGTRFEMFTPGHYRMVKTDKREDMVVIASEPLTFERTDWLTIPSNTLVVVTPRLNVLLYPIEDENAAAPGAVRKLAVCS